MDRDLIFIFGLIGGFLILAMTTLLISQSMTEKTTRHCLENGHSVVECRVLR